MENNIIDKTYSEAVIGLDEETLKDCDLWYNYVLNLPKAQQVVYTVILLNWQIENGGFHQYFFNSYGQFAYLTIKNLNLIEATHRADLLDSATHLVNEEYFIEDKFRHLIFNREFSKIVDFDDLLFDKLNELDDKYYNMEDENIFDLLQRYLDNHE
ncbi:DMP19 family protein [Chryseobacterium sp. CP-77]|uniref:DMP19 family protein n=1 Tax=Chryseobacterium sp. CP-77 TaxID=3116594 RepID=UPI002ED4002D